TNENEQEVVAIDEFQEAFPRTASIRLRNSSIEVKLFTERGIEVTPEIQRVGNLVQLDISSLDSGIYFLQFKSKGKVEIKRMVIN
ncbi:MAG: T9SS type A sorting domain-containing protein, partial [Flavobacteriaceae bacterium]|nr:T9SS type A sorting domain-containing protein [Flavobacteriaceae bacterium]